LYEMHVASPEEYKDELIKKLSEEIKEFTDDSSVEELADIIEVTEALKKLSEYTNTEIVRMKKREEGGGFDQRIILKGEKS